MIKSVMITGANGGLGKEAARQLALQPGVQKIYLACRNESKAKAAKSSLEQSTGKSVFEVVLLDVSNLDSVKSAIESIQEPIDALVMNAGGMGGKNFDEKTPYGVIQMFAVNVLGHVVLLEELLKASKLNQVALYAGSEAARGVSKMGMKQPKLKTSSVEEFKSIMDGSFYEGKVDAMVAYAHVKYIAALWITSLSRKYPKVRLITVSPGGTSGTAIMNDLPPMLKFMFKTFGSWLMPMMGMMHKLPIGAKRYVDGLNDPAYETGKFYGSKKPVITGPLIDQSTLFPDLSNVAIQDNARVAVLSFIRP